MYGLIVEDDVTQARNIQKILKSRNHTFDICFDGESAKKMSEQHSYQMILLDLRLPDGFGIKLISSFRKYIPHVKIMIMSALISSQTVTEALNAGADDYLRKSFDTNELYARLMSIARRPEVIKQTDQLKICGITLCEKDLVLIYDERSIKITDKEKIILHCLSDYNPISVSYRQLMNHIWGYYGDDIKVNSLHAHIKRLRKKLHYLKPSKEVIVTIKQYGYSLNSDS